MLKIIFTMYCSRCRCELMYPHEFAVLPGSSVKISTLLPPLRGKAGMGGCAAKQFTIHLQFLKLNYSKIAKLSINESQIFS
jgi:hypothetical protein